MPPASTRSAARSLDPNSPRLMRGGRPRKTPQEAPCRGEVLSDLASLEQNSTLPFDHVSMANVWSRLVVWLRKNSKMRAKCIVMSPRGASGANFRGLYLFFKGNFVGLVRRDPSMCWHPSNCSSLGQERCTASRAWSSTQPCRVES